MKKLFLPLILILALTSCGGKNPSPGNDSPGTTVSTKQVPPEESGIPAELREIIVQNREAVFREANESIYEIVKSYRTQDLDIERDKEIAEIMKEQASEIDNVISVFYGGENTGGLVIPETITLGEASEEIDYVFDMLKYGYARYTYFGGDGVFLPLKEKIKSELSAMDPVDINTYTRLLAENLHSVIKDNHFAVANAFGLYEPMEILNGFYYCEELYFTKNGGDYTTAIDGKEYKLAAGEASQHILPSLDKDGGFAYIYGLMLSEGTEDYEVTIQLEDAQTGEVLEKSAFIRAASVDYNGELEQNVYELSKTDGISVLTNRNLPNESGEAAEMKAFIKTGAELRKEEALVLDLRSHWGGYSSYAGQWIENFTGVYPPYSAFANAVMTSKTAREIDDNSGILHSLETMWSDVFYFKPQLLPNDVPVIVLTDGGIVSAGEFFVGYLQQMDNVIFAGVPTRGQLVTGNIGTTLLPKSKVIMGFGVELHIRPDLSQFEGMGFEPDLWIPPGESLERTLKFIKRYHLDEEATSE